MFTSHVASYSAVKGSVEYNIPIDYSKLNETELNEKAKVYFFNALKYKDNTLNDDISSALVLYQILQNINPENINYPIKLGILYDKLEKDRQAKGAFSKAIGINPDYYESYFYLGEFYYNREMYKKALKYYKLAHARTNFKNYDLLYRMGDIYEKFGDTKTALIYLEQAIEQSSNPEIQNKINRIRNMDSINKEYYENLERHY